MRELRQWEVSNLWLMKWPMKLELECWLCEFKAHILNLSPSTGLSLTHILNLSHWPRVISVSGHIHLLRFRGCSLAVRKEWSMQDGAVSCLCTVCTSVLPTGSQAPWHQCLLGFPLYHTLKYFNVQYVYPPNQWFRLLDYTYIWVFFFVIAH